jgi:hypothetical protein
MRALVVVLQIVISVVVTASLMPLLLVSVPAAQNERVGLAIMAGLFAASFVVIALVWPRRKSTRRSP